jgi:hypothetical protein
MLTKQRQQKSKTEDDKTVSKYLLKHTQNYEKQISTLLIDTSSTNNVAKFFKKEFIQYS